VAEAGVVSLGFLCIFLCIFLCGLALAGAMVFGPDAPDTVSVEPRAFGFGPQPPHRRPRPAQRESYGQPRTNPAPSVGPSHCVRRFSIRNFSIQLLAVFCAAVEQRPFLPSLTHERRKTS
jgi:hypothetical protein